MTIEKAGSMVSASGSGLKNSPDPEQHPSESRAFNRDLAKVQNSESFLTGTDTEQGDHKTIGGRQVRVNEDLSPPDTSSELHNWVWVMTEADLEGPPDSVPAALVSLSTKQMLKAAESSVVDAPELVEPGSGQQGDVLKRVREKLEQRKTSLGGSPNYPDGKPVLKRSRLLFGQAWEPMRNWVSKALERKWPPNFFWQTFSEVLGQKTGESRDFGRQTQYEYCVLALESIQHIKDHMIEIQRRLRSQDNAAAYFAIQTGWAIHPNKGSPETLCATVSGYVEAFEKSFIEAEAGGKLDRFFDKAMEVGDVCLEARYRTLNNYLLGKVIKYNHSSSLEEILDEKMAEFTTEWFETNRNGEFPRSADFENWVKDQDVLGFSFKGGAGENFGKTGFAKGVLPGENCITGGLIRNYLDYQVEEGNLPE